MVRDRIKYVLSFAKEGPDCQSKQRLDLAAASYKKTYEKGGCLGYFFAA